jgi:hypothetical protein
MILLNIISVAFWLVLTYQGIRVFRSLRDTGLSKREVTAITIVLLCGLNLAYGVGCFFTETGKFFNTGQQLMVYLAFGISMFQLLLATFVLDHIAHNKTN